MPVPSPDKGGGFTDRPSKPMLKKKLACNSPSVASETGQIQRRRTFNRKQTMNLTTLKISSLNIDTYKDKEEEILEVMRERNVDIMGMAETRMGGRESGKDLGDGYVLMFSGEEGGGSRHGVAMIVGPRLSPYIPEVQLISERLMVCTLKLGGKKHRIFQVHAPQKGCALENKDTFMEILE